MPQSLFALTINQLGDLANIIASLIPIALSLTFWRYFQAAYLRAWNLGLSVGMVTLAIDFFTVDQGHPFLPTSVACLAYVISNYFIVLTAAELANRPVWARAYAVVGAVSWLSYLGMTAAGLPFEQAFLAGLLGYIAAHWLLAWALVQTSRGIQSARWMLALSSFWMGLTIFLYPVLLNTPYLWLGFLAAAVAHLMSGVSMLVFALSELALTLQQANAELRKVDALQTEFLGNLNHELRTPFQAIQTAVYLLAQGPDRERLSGQQRETVALLSETADRLFGLVTDLVDFSTMAQGALTYDHASHDLTQLVESTGQSLRGLFDQRGIDLEFELPGDVITAEVDGRRLHQVLTNLLTNALKFTPPGGTVTVRLWQEGAEVRLSVTDTGEGVPPAELEAIFQRFYQVDGSRTRQAGGNGLGLAICKAIVVEGHGGRIWAESEGQGSTFTVALPLEQTGARKLAAVGVSRAAA